jgi:hypothetical protein
MGSLHLLGVLALVVGSQLACSQPQASNGHPDAATPDAGPEASEGDDEGAPDSGPDAAPAGPETLVWAFEGWAQVVAAIGAHPAAFTHFSPAFYTVNYEYASGVAYFATCPLTDGECTAPGTDDFEGMTTGDIAKSVAASGVHSIPLIFGGANNEGTDKGIQILLDDAGAQTNFITAMVGEAKTKGYAGYNLDWEVGTTTGSAYSAKLVTFIDAFRAKLSPLGMTLSIDIISANVNQTDCSVYPGFIDLTALGKSTIDRIFIEDYAKTLGTPSSTCRKQPYPTACPKDTLGFFDVMCTFAPLDKIGIALSASPITSNPVAGAALSAMQTYGFTSVAVWPGANDQGPGGKYLFLDNASLAPSGTWYTLLENFRQH